MRRAARAAVEINHHTLSFIVNFILCVLLSYFMPRIIVQPPYERRVLDVCVDKDYFLVGRRDENDLTVLDEMVSRFHATLFSYQNSLYIIDHSTNGTYVSAGGMAVPVPRWSGFVEEKFDDFEEMEQFLKLVIDPDKVGLLARGGKRLCHEGRIIIPMRRGAPFEMLFLDQKCI